jgi:tRNA G46 methylase TrmB
LKSKDRVQDLAEVYTNAREVVAMLDLVKDVRYDSTFLEPGCGNGNFIVEILSRKFKIIKKLTRS